MEAHGPLWARGNYGLGQGVNGRGVTELDSVSFEMEKIDLLVDAN